MGGSHWKYLKELEEIKGDKWQESEEEQKTWCDDYIKKSYYIWTDIRFMDQIVGFLITGVKPDCHPSCDYFICQSYVLPEYRNKGLMTDAVNKFVKLHLGRYCMIILKNNNYAKKFWDNRFEDLGYSRMKLLDIGCLRKDEEQYGYEQQDKR